MFFTCELRIKSTKPQYLSFAKLHYKILINGWTLSTVGHVGVKMMILKSLGDVFFALVHFQGLSFHTNLLQVISKKCSFL